MEAKIKQDAEKLKKLKPSKVVHKKTFELGSVICTSSVSGVVYLRGGGDIGDDILQFIDCDGILYFVCI